MKYKDITKYSDAREKILSGLTKLSAPIIQTISPRGSNIIFQDQGGLPNVTNDGYTIAQHIKLEDPIENVVSEIVKHAAIRTNNVAGDGTSTTILFSDMMIRAGFNLIDNGYNPMDLKRDLDKVSKILSDEVDKYTYKVKTKKDLEYVAKVSSNNDSEIAKNTADIIDKAKEDGLVFIEPNPSKSETKVIEELGFLLDNGMFSPHLANVEGRFVARYDDVPVLITDKRLYYEEEVITILQKTAEMGSNQLVIIAQDFIGQAPNILLANHSKPEVNMNILFIKCSDPATLDDLAAYLGGQVFTEKRGSMVKELKKEDFLRADRIFSDNQRTIISSPLKKNVTADLRTKALKEALKGENEGSQDYDKLKTRIAHMTNGVITIKVGAKTAVEMNEKIYRYEDAINATRNAYKNGYVVGGGVTLHNIFATLTKAKLAEIPPDLLEVVKKFCDTSLRQIAINCNKPISTVMDGVGKVVGYNATTDKVEDLLEAGVIEPSVVLKMSIENSISVAGLIISGGYLVTNKLEKTNDKHNE